MLRSFPLLFDRPSDPLCFPRSPEHAARRWRGRVLVGGAPGVRCNLSGGEPRHPHLGCRRLLLWRRQVARFWGFTFRLRGRILAEDAPLPHNTRAGKGNHEASLHLSSSSFLYLTRLSSCERTTSIRREGEGAGYLSCNCQGDKKGHSRLQPTRDTVGLPNSCNPAQPHGPSIPVETVFWHDAMWSNMAS